MARNDNKQRTSVDLDTEKMAVIVSIVNKEDNKVVETREYEAREVHESLRPNVSLYGLSKLIQDRASDVPIGVAKLDAMSEVLTQLREGQWAKERKVGATVVSAEVEALSRLKQISVPAAQAALKNYPKEAREKILANPQIVELAAVIRKEREEAATVDLSDLAGEPTPPEAQPATA